MDILVVSSRHRHVDLYHAFAAKRILTQQVPYDADSVDYWCGEALRKDTTTRNTASVLNKHIVGLRVVRHGGQTK